MQHVEDSIDLVLGKPKVKSQVGEEGVCAAAEADQLVPLVIIARIAFDKRLVCARCHRN